MRRPFFESVEITDKMMRQDGCVELSRASYIGDRYA